MNHEISRLNKEQGIIAAKKKEAQSAYYAAEAQRTQMRMHFERMQREHDEDRKFSEFFKEKRREDTYDLGNQVIMLSTKPKDNLDINDDPEVLTQESRLRMLTQELEMVQRRYMLASQEKDFLLVRRAKMNAGQLKGDVDDARQGLTMFTMESERDVRQMRTELQSAQDKLREVNKRVKQQESKQ